MSNPLPEQKLIGEWMLATTFIISGIWIAMNVEWVLGTTTGSYYGALLIAFILNLVAGLIYSAITTEVARDL
ncbi:MAG: hypothetical protein KAI18_00470 [Candidatus Aenigmarchaeota archaeon]|nr:hypothetical protein [Candidatus Aenigmarchaeota archaeon]